jgi:hypothetical protein
MPKVKISEYSATANSNTDVASINIDEGCAPSGINNAIRAIMGHLKDFQQGTNGDPFNGPHNGTVGATTANTGAFTTLTTTGTINLITVGRGAGAVATNTAVGASALATNGAGSANTAVGAQAGTGITSGSNNSIFGQGSGNNLTAGSSNTFIGQGAGYGFGGTNTASNNIFIGAISGFRITTGGNNTAVGTDSLQANTTASNNTAVGYQAGYTNQTGDRNTFLGVLSGNLQTSSFNTFVGARSGLSSTGERNTFVGAVSNIPSVANYGCGELMTTGSKNTILGGFNGNQGGLNIIASDNYIVLSDGEGNPLISTNSTRSVALNGAVPQTGTGITFPATQSASSNANTLDDYEEGNFIPTITFGGASVGVTYNATFTGATYTKIGNRVCVTGYILLTNKGSSTGDVGISNLPFVSESGTTKYLGASVGGSNFTFANQFWARMAPAVTTIDLYETTVLGAITPLTNSDFTNSSEVYFSATYSF